MCVCAITIARNGYLSVDVGEICKHITCASFKRKTNMMMKKEKNNQREDINAIGKQRMGETTCLSANECQLGD